MSSLHHSLQRLRSSCDFKQPSLFLEDLYVDPSVRNRGAGKALFRALGKVAEERDCQRMDWMVLNWNEWVSTYAHCIFAELHADLLSFTQTCRPSIAFYEKVLGAKPMKEWTQERLELDGIARLRSLK